MTAVTFPNGNGYSDDGTTAHDMRNGGHRTNLLPMIADTISVANSAVTAAAQAVPAATTATNSATTATQQAAIATAAANTAASIVQVKQPSEIAGIDPVLDFQFSASTAVPAGVITGSSSKWVFNQAGVLVNVPAGTAPIDFDPVTSALRGLLVEEARTNLLTYSQQFDNAAWTKAGVTVTANAVAAPDGTVSADLLKEDTSTGGHTIYASGVTSGTFALTVYGKPSGRNLAIDVGSAGNGRRVVFDLINGVVSSDNAVVGTGGTVSAMNGSISQAPNGFFRCSVVIVASGSNTVVLATASGTSVSYAGNGTSGVYLWQADLQAGSFATSPIVTTSSTVTRAADVNTLLLSGVPGWNASEGTIYVEADTQATFGSGAYRTVAQLSNNGTSFISLLANTSGQPQAQVADAGTIQASIVDAVTPFAATTKFAVSWAANNFAMSVSGRAALTDTSGTVPAVTTLSLGSTYDGAAAGRWNGRIRRVTLFPRYIQPSTLQLLTA